MLAYVQLVQQKERDLGVDILTHQKWCVSKFPMLLPSFSFVCFDELPADSMWVVSQEWGELYRSYPAKRELVVHDQLSRLGFYGTRLLRIQIGRAHV